MQRLASVLAFGFVVACGHADSGSGEGADTLPRAGGAGEKSFEERREESRLSIDAAACAAKGGEVRQEGMLGLFRCTVPYMDGGAICSDHADCLGRCKASDDVTAADAPGGAAVGRCEDNDSPFGCYALVERGEVSGFLCVD